MNLWLTMVIAGLATYAIRLSFIWLLSHEHVPIWLRRALRFIPPAVLMAIVFPEVLLREGALDISFGNLRLLAAIIASLVAWRTRNAVLTIVAGMITLWAFTWLI